MPQAPWEKYQAQAEAEGPWTKYQQAEAAPVPAETDTRTAGQVALDQLINFGKGIPQAITSIPSALAGTVTAGLDQFTGGRLFPGAAAQMMQATSEPVVTMGRNVGALIAPGSVQAPTQQEQEAAAQAGGSIVGGIALGGALNKIAPKLALPSKAAASAKFEQVMNAAGDLPVESADAAKAVARAYELKRTTKTTPPGVLRAFNELSQQTDILGNKVPLTLRETSDMASAAGRLSSSERQGLNRPMKAQVTAFYDAIKTANRDTATKAGMGELYDQAINEYRRANTLGAAADVLRKYAVRAVFYAALGAGGTAGHDIYRKFFPD